MDLGFLAPLSFFAAVVLIIYIRTNAYMKKQKMEHEERMLAIERGVSIPAAPATTKVKNPYKWPLILIGIGFAYLIAQISLADEDWVWALLPMFIGGAILLSHRHFDRKHKSKDTDSSSNKSDDTSI